MALIDSKGVGEIMKYTVIILGGIAVIALIVYIASGETPIKDNTGTDAEDWINKNKGLKPKVGGKVALTIVDLDAKPYKLNNKGKAILKALTDNFLQGNYILGAVYDSKVKPFMKQLQTQGDTALVSGAFLHATKTPLFSWLNDKLSDSNYNDIVSYTNKLPKYV